MRLNRIIFILSILVIITSSAGGYLYFSVLHDQAGRRAHQEAAAQVKSMASRINLRINEQHQSLNFLAKISDLQAVLAPTPATASERTKANNIIDSYKVSMLANVCYLLDRNGLTIASSNRDQPSSFVGKNYAFRPYFKKAIQGKAYTYMARGVTSRKRGLYFSNPIYNYDHKEVIGVVVAKFPVKYIDTELGKINDGVSFLTDSHSVIFSSSQPDLLFKTLWPLNDLDMAELAVSRQFGDNYGKWGGFSRLDPTHAVDQHDKEYIIHEVEIAYYPGWRIIYLHDLAIVSQHILTPLFKLAELIILFLCLLISVTTGILYRKANQEIKHRKAIENKISHLNQELEQKVAERNQELLTAQEKLVRREKLAALGQLAGSVAHDLRNPLGAISNISYLLKMDVDDKTGTKIKKHLEILNKSVQRSEAITAQLLQFSKTLPPKLALLDINEAILENLADTPIPNNIFLVRQLTHSLPPCQLDKHYIQQMLSNLITNACQFMPQGGNLTISTSLAGDGNEILIADTGPGIPKENLNKIFEPLFTTRASGIGLGMAIVKDIVKKHNGSIEIITPENGKGTAFRIILPHGKTQNTSEKST